MVMRKTTDAALISIPEKERQRCQDAIGSIKSTRWLHAYEKGIGTLLIRRRATGRWSKRRAAEVETSLKDIVKTPEKHIIWAWTAGGEERYFPGTDIYILFSRDTTEAQRKNILKGIKGIKVHTYADMEVQPPSKTRKSAMLKPSDMPGFSGTNAKQAWKIWQEQQPEVAEDKPKEICIPVARVSIPEERREELFTFAQEIQGLPGVRLVTPDVNVLGKNLMGEPQQAELPPTTDTSFVQRNLVDAAWRILHPPALASGDHPFVLSSEKVAVFDLSFDPHPLIDFELIGYDAADGDYDPMTPTLEALHHGLEMSGVIGGRDHGGTNECGIAPGSTIIPIRPSWIRESDFHEVNGYTVYNDFEEYVERYTTTWIDAVLRLYQLSFSGVGLANMSLSMNSDVWQETGLQLGQWINWSLYEGNHGEGVFAAASAGNNPARIVIALPAKLAQTFAVGWGERATYSMLGNQGWRLELVVDDGRWPAYLEDGTVSNGSNLAGGSSMCTAIVTGVAALMKSVDPTLTAEELKTLLRLTTRKIPPSIAMQTAPDPGASMLQGYEGPNTWMGYGPGYCSEFGHGFLDAHYALLAAWKQRYPAAELWSVHYRQPSTIAMIQLRHLPSSSYAGKRLGKFWAFESYHNTDPQRWQHDRAPGLEEIDQVIDPFELPFGEHCLVGDFDGDHIDEIALQLDGDEFWPLVTDHPAHSMLVQKYNEGNGRWETLGDRSPYASGLASPQVIFPAEHPIHEVFTAKLLGDNRDCIVSHGDHVLNALVYDAASNTFQRLGPENFTPLLYSDDIANTVGGGRIVDHRILKAAPLDTGAFHHAVLIVSSITSLRHGGFLDLHPGAATHQRLPGHLDLTHFPATSDFTELLSELGPGQALASFGYSHRMAISILGFDETGEEWINYSFSSLPDDTHLLLNETSIPYVESIHQCGFAFPNNSAYYEIAIHLANDHLYYLLLSNGPGYTFNQSSIYQDELALDGRISRIKAGEFGLDGEKTQLAWLSDDDHGNCVRFLQWDHVQRMWTDPGITINHGRPDNHAVDLAVAKGFSFPDLIDDRDMVALLMEKPVANTYFTYRYSDTAGFMYMGLL